MNRKIYSTEKFKKGDTVWFCNFELQPSGRVKNNFKPQAVTVKSVSQDQVEINKGDSYGWWGIPSAFNIDYREYILGFGNYDYNNSLGVHISFTKEEAEDKYNEMIKDAIESRYQNFRRIEDILRRQLL